MKTSRPEWFAACTVATSPRNIDYDEFQREVRRRKRERWAKILATEPPGRAVGRRPRDPEKESILLRLDRIRLEKEGPKPVC